MGDLGRANLEEHSKLSGRLVIQDLKPYSEYRDSGVPWLEVLPSSWEIKRAKHVFRVRDVRSSTGKEELLTVSARSGVVPRREQKVTMFKADSYVGHKLCWPGDLVVNSLWAWMQGLGIANHHGIISTAYSVYRPRPEYAAYARYFHYTLRSEAYKWELLTRSKGVWLSRLQLSDSAFLDMAMILPPEEEQAAIVRFLDHADRKIRRYIRAKQKLIKLLEEQKQAIIHRAVTRGLNPDVPLRSSGVEWLGDVPEHWEVRKLKQIVRRGRRITYGIVQPGEPDSNGRFMVRGQDYSSGWAGTESIFRVSPVVEEPYRRSRLMAGDLVLTIVGAGVGNVAIVPEWLDGANITQTTARISLDPDKCDPSYIAYVLSTRIGYENVRLVVKGAAQPGLNLEHVRLFLVTHPPIHEQRAIANWIEQTIRPIQLSIQQYGGEIELLREYHTRLIADVVTGKLDVRAAAAALPADDHDEPDAVALDDLLDVEEAEEPAGEMEEVGV